MVAGREGKLRVRKGRKRVKRVKKGKGGFKLLRERNRRET